MGLSSLVHSLFNMGGQEKNFKLSTVRSKAFETKTLCTNIEFHVHFIYLKRAIRGQSMLMAKKEKKCEGRKLAKGEKKDRKSKDVLKKKGD